MGALGRIAQRHRLEVAVRSRADVEPATNVVNFTFTTSACTEAPGRWLEKHNARITTSCSMGRVDISFDMDATDS